MSDLDRLLRWEDAGGTWRVLARSPRSGTSTQGVDLGGAGSTVALTIALCRCDGGEEADRFTTSAPAVIEHVADRETSEDVEPGLAD